MIDLSVLSFDSDYENYNVCLATDKYDFDNNVKKQATENKPEQEFGKNDDNHSNFNIVDSTVPTGPATSLDTSGISGTIGGSIRVSQNAIIDNNPQQATPPRKPFVVRDEVYNLLRVLPKADYYSNQPKIFDPKKTVEFLRSLKI